MSPDAAKELARTYQLRNEALGPYRDAVWRILVREVFGRYVSPDGAVLDLGSGWGKFTRSVRAWRKYAMDASPDLLRHVDRDTRPLVQDCSKPWPFEDGKLGLVFSSNFFEHLPDREALRRVLDEALRCLEPGGKLVCVGPNARVVGGAYWDFLDHALPLTDRSLSEALRLAGFDVVRCEPRFLPYSMSQGFRPLLALVVFYLRCPPLWRLFGKQFLIVAQKPRQTT